MSKQYQFDEIAEAHFRAPNLEGDFVADVCSYDNGVNGLCIYANHDDEFCCLCLQDTIKALREHIRSIKKGKK